jgi:hypothetical protein
MHCGAVARPGVSAPKPPAEPPASVRGVFGETSWPATGHRIRGALRDSPGGPGRTG